MAAVPPFNRLLRRSRAAALSSHQDYDERLTKSQGYMNSDLWDGAQYAWWYDRMQPYVKNDQLFLCPSDSDHDSAQAGGSVQSYKTDYAYNTFLGGGGGAPLAEVRTPATTVMNTERDLAYVRLYNDPSGSRYGMPPTARHNDGFNNNFVDGHAKWHKGFASSNATVADEGWHFETTWP